jgi:hypothetical protein
MKWSHLFYCAAVVALTTFLVTRGISPWFTVPLAGFAAWWTYLCTCALWTVVSFRVAVWRARLLPPLPRSMEDLETSPKINTWIWLANPKLDSSINAATMVGVLVFPSLLWLPLIFWLRG